MWYQENDGSILSALTRNGGTRPNIMVALWEHTYTGQIDEKCKNFVTSLKANFNTIETWAVTFSEMIRLRLRL